MNFLNQVSKGKKQNQKANRGLHLEALEDRFVPTTLPLFGMYETKATALNLGTLTKDVDRSNLKLDGQADWIKFQTKEIGGRNDRVFIQSDQGSSKLQLQLFDEKGNLQGSAGGRSVDYTAVKLADLPAGVYYAVVTGINKATGIRYNLHVDAPVFIGTQNDSYENNNSKANAKGLGLVQPGKSLTVDARLPKNDQDWFSFRLSRTAGPESRVLVTAPQGWANNWNMEVFNYQGKLVGASSGTSGAHGVLMDNQLAGSYLVHIFSDGDRGIGAYRLKVQANLAKPALFTASTALPQLPNPQLNSLVQQLVVDGQLSREDWIGGGGIFDAIENDGVVSSSEFTSLQLIISNSSIIDNPSISNGNGSIAMYNYVYNLAGKVINGDFANATYQGLPLGNLASGSTANQLALLVDKWFLGTDHPDAGGNYPYQEANGNPFFGPNGPSLNDINQGEAGDCYFLSSVGTILSKQLTNSNPNYIALYNPVTGENPNGIFINNGDGTYTVQFFYQSQSTGSWVPDYVTVDQFFPTTGNGKNTEWTYANAYYDFSNTSIPLWVAVVEKAYVQENASARWSPSTSASSVSNNYQTISGLYYGNQALMQITGQDGYLNVTNLSNLTYQEIVTAYLNGVGVVFGTKNKPEVDLNGGSVRNDEPVVGSHDYMMYGYNATNQTILLRNPWGSQGLTGTYNAVSPPQNLDNTYLLIEATVSFLQQNCDGYYAINPNITPNPVNS